MNNKKYLPLIWFVLGFGILVIMACSIGNLGMVQGSGNVVEESRPVSGITSVELTTLGNLTIELGDMESFRIEAEHNLMKYIKTDVFAGTFRIKTKNGIRLENTKPVNYYLTVKSLDSINISSSGNIYAPDLEANEFSINISSSGNLEMGNLDAETLTVRISSSGDIIMGLLTADSLDVNISSGGNLDIAGGQVKTQDVTISSSGDFTAQDLKSENADVRLSSGGSATIWVQDTLNAKLSSSGDLRYRGDPSVNATTSSSGDVIQIGE